MPDILFFLFSFICFFLIVILLIRYGYKAGYKTGYQDGKEIMLTVSGREEKNNQWLFSDTYNGYWK